MTKSSDMATLLNSSSKIPGADIASGSLTVSAISATGTPSSSTFLRGDGSWQTPAGGVTSIVAGNGIAVSGSGAVTVSQDIYTGTNAQNTSFPIGTTVSYANTACTTYVLGAAVPLWLNSASNSTRFENGSNGPAVAGTWRFRGNVNIVQRVA